MKAKFLYSKFWKDCRAAREQRGWSRAAVGKELGVGGSAVAKWEANKLKREDMWRILAMCVIYDFDVYHYYEVIESPKLVQKRLIEDKTLTRYEPKIEEVSDDWQSVDQDLNVDWNNFRYDEDNRREVWHRELGWILDPYQVVA